MEIKHRTKHAFRNRILKRQLRRQDAWEKQVVDKPEATRGGENSIPHQAIKMEGDHPPLSGFPGSIPQIIGSVINIRKSVYGLKRNRSDGKKQMDGKTLDELLDLAPSRDTALMVHETYNRLGQVSSKIADWPREQGYAAHAGHPLGGMALYPPMAMVRPSHGLLLDIDLTDSLQPI